MKTVLQCKSLCQSLISHTKSVGRQQPQTYRRTMPAGDLVRSLQRPDLNMIVSMGLCEETEDNEKLWQSFPNCLG